MIASVIYHSTIQYFKGKCDIVNKIENLEEMASLQCKNFDNKHLEFKIHKNAESTFVQSVKRYLSKKAKNTENN